MDVSAFWTGQPTRCPEGNLATVVREAVSIAHYCRGMARTRCYQNGVLTDTDFDVTSSPSTSRNRSPWSGSTWWHPRSMSWC